MKIIEKKKKQTKISSFKIIWISVIWMVAISFMSIGASGILFYLKWGSGTALPMMITQMIIPFFGAIIGTYVIFKAED